MTNLAVLTIFRNEAHIMYEWCKYYLDFGFDHLYIINNDSEDNYQQVINDLPSNKITLFHESGQQIQIPALQKYYQQIKSKYEWIFITDLDEFLYFNDSSQTLTKFVDNHPSNIQVIRIQWKIFQPTQFTQPKSVIENNTVWIKKTVSDRLCKSIVRTTISPRKIHHHVPKVHKSFIKRYKVTDNVCQINHYRYNSWEFMLGIKLSRGGGNQGTSRWKNAKFSHFGIGSNLNDNTIDTTLKSQCSSLVQEINSRPQTYPMVSIYNNKYYNKIKKYLERHPLITPGNNVQSILTFNQKIIKLMDQPNI